MTAFWEENDITLRQLSDFLQQNGFSVTIPERSHLTVELPQGRVNLAIQAEHQTLRLFSLLPIEEGHLSMSKAEISPFVLRPYRDAVACDLEIAFAGGLLPHHLLWALAQFAKALLKLQEGISNVILPVAKLPINRHRFQKANLLNESDFEEAALLERLQAAGFQCQVVEHGIFILKNGDSAFISFWNEDQAVQLNRSFDFVRGTPEDWQRLANHLNEMYPQARFFVDGTQLLAVTRFGIQELSARDFYVLTVAFLQGVPELLLLVDKAELLARE